MYEQRRPAYVSRHARGWTLVLPSASLCALVMDRLCDKYPRFDYVHRFRDVNGFGLQLGIGPEGPPRPPKPEAYRSPSAGLYKNPGYDLVNI